MNTFIVIMIVLIVWITGIVLGFLLNLTLRKNVSYSGVMKIIREDNKLVYSLELYDNPSVLEHVSEVVFKIETSDESSDRK